MDIASIGTYGGPFSDASIVTDPTTQVASDFYNRQSEDVAQMTRTGTKAILKFTLINTVASVTVSAGNCRTQWGTGASYHPTVARTATGAYTITFATSYTDGLGVAETVSIFGAHASVNSTDVADAGHIQCVVATNVVTLKVMDMTGAAADFTGEEITVWFY